jgi:hypothetical protein
VHLGIRFKPGILMFLLLLRDPDTPRNLSEFLDRCHELVSTARNGDDYVVVVRTEPKSLSKNGDSLNEIVLLHDRIGPNPLQELVLLDDSRTFLNQDQQHVEGLARQRNHLAIPQEQPAMDVDNEVPECVIAHDGWIGRTGCHCTPPWTLPLTCPRMLCGPIGCMAQNRNVGRLNHALLQPNQGGVQRRLVWAPLTGEPTMGSLGSPTRLSGIFRTI